MVEVEESQRETRSRGRSTDGSPRVSEQERPVPTVTRMETRCTLHSVYHLSISWWEGERGGRGREGHFGLKMKDECAAAGPGEEEVSFTLLTPLMYFLCFNSLSSFPFTLPCFILLALARLVFARVSPCPRVIRERPRGKAIPASMTKRASVQPRASDK